MLILKGSDAVMHRWAAGNDLPDDILLSSSPTAYITDDLAYDWLEHFIRLVKKPSRGSISPAYYRWPWLTCYLPLLENSGSCYGGSTAG